MGPIGLIGLMGHLTPLTPIRMFRPALAIVESGNLMRALAHEISTLD